MTAWTRVAERVTYSPLFGRTVLHPLACWGYRRFRKTADTPRAAYAAMRKLYGNADARLFDRLCARIAEDTAMVGTIRTSEGIAGDEVDDVVDRLRRDGYAILHTKLAPSECDELERVARAALCTLIGPHDVLHERRRFDESNPVATRYELDEAAIVQSAAAQRLIVDASLLAMAEQYLGARPVQDLVAMWWSTPVGTTASAAAAQHFHFDLDRVRFLKVFVFLSDVDDHTGPHVYVRGTHRNVPAGFRKDGRRSDAEVFEAFGDDVHKIGGPRGTIFLADTRGLHKGMNLVTGHRLVFQTEYAISLFGAPYNRPVLEHPIPEFVAVLEQHRSSFRRFRLASVAQA